MGECGDDLNEWDANYVDINDYCNYIGCYYGKDYRYVDGDDAFCNSRSLRPVYNFRWRWCKMNKTQVALTFIATSCIIIVLMGIAASIPIGLAVSAIIFGYAWFMDLAEE